MVDKELLSAYEQSLLEKAFIALLYDPKIKTVSFDVFDTLLLRDTSLPSDLFLQVGKHPSVKRHFGDAPSYRYYRIAAEKKARAHTQNEEISIEAIYAEFPKLTREQRQQIIAIELDEEANSLFANTQLSRWIKIAKDAGREVVYSSDMYLSAAQIRQLGFDAQEDKFFLSSELQKTKRKGTLFTYLLKALSIQPSELLHIGDNRHADIKMARQHGIKTLSYQLSTSALELFERERIYVKADSLVTLNTLRKSAMLLNPFEEEHPRFFYDFGAFLGAPLLLAFSQWLLQQARENSITQLNFLMREGRVFSHTFRMLIRALGIEERFEINQVFTSRRALLLASLDPDDIRFNRLNLLSLKELTLEDFYTIFKLPVNDRLQEEKHLLLKVLLSKQAYKATLDLVAEDFDSHKANIKDAIMEERRHIKRYFEQLGIHERSIMVDFGGSGTVMSYLDAIFTGNKFRDLLFFISPETYEKRLKTMPIGFLSVDESDHRISQLLRASPYIFEIIFNGLEYSTAGYMEEDGKTIPYHDPRIEYTEQEEETIAAFDLGVDHFFHTFFNSPKQETSISPRLLLSMIGRVLEFPTSREAFYLGDLLEDTSYLSDEKIALIDEDAYAFVKEEGVERLHKQLLNEPLYAMNKALWPHGLIQRVDDKLLRSHHYDSRQNINQKAIASLLAQIERSQVSELSVYGTGLFFDTLYPELKAHHIHISHLMDSRAEIATFDHAGHEVISALQAMTLHKKLTVLIASLAFAEEIERKLALLAQQKGVILEILSPLSEKRT